VCATQEEATRLQMQILLRYDNLTTKMSRFPAHDALSNMQGKSCLSRAACLAHPNAQVHAIQFGLKMLYVPYIC